MARDEMIEFEGTIERETEMAWLFDCDEVDMPIWLPKSQCAWDETEEIMSIPEWLAMEKGLI